MITQRGERAQKTVFVVWAELMIAFGGRRGFDREDYVWCSLGITIISRGFFIYKHMHVYSLFRFLKFVFVTVY